MGNWGFITLGTSGRIPTKGQGSWVTFLPISIHHWLRTVPAGFTATSGLIHTWAEHPPVARESPQGETSFPKSH